MTSPSTAPRMHLVAFSGLAMIDININPNIFDSGGFVLSWHGFFTFIAVGTAVFLVARWARRDGLESDVVYSTAIWAIIGGIVGARFIHVIDNWSFYSDNPGRILAIWSGGIGLFGAILGGFIGGAIYARFSKYPVGKLADLTAPALLIVQTIGRVGDIINGEHWARATSWVWGFVYQHPDSPSYFTSLMNNSNAAVRKLVPPGSIEALAQHPAVVYEMIWNMIALAIVWKMRGRLKPDGMLFVLYLALYSMGRFTIQFIRLDKVWVIGLQEAHFIALAVLAITIPLLVFRERLANRSETAAAPTPTHPKPRQRRRRGR